MKRKVGVIAVKNPVSFEHAVLRRLAEKLRKLCRSDDDLLQLADKLDDIACGHDPSEVLGVKPRRGNDPAKEAAHLNQNLMLTWLATAILPVAHKGLGLTMDVAVAMASAEFSIDEESIRRYWSRRGHSVLATDGSFDFDSLRPKRHL